MLSAHLDLYLAYSLLTPLSSLTSRAVGILTAASILPMSWRLALLSSPLLRVWRKWASLTASEGLHACFPGSDEATCRLRSYLSGLWLDAGSPPSRGSFFMQTAVMGGWQKLGVSYPRGGPQQTVRVGDAPFEPVPPVPNAAHFRR